MILTEGYSIWLEPVGEQKVKLDNLIKRIAILHGVDNFGFHVTLLGGIIGCEEEILDKTESLATSLERFPLDLINEVVMEDIWQKTLAIRVKITDQLMGAHMTAQSMFDNPNQVYDPHASLVYAEGMPMRTRDSIVHSLDSGIFSVSFSIEAVHLYRTQGSIRDWTKIGSFPIK